MRLKPHQTTYAQGGSLGYYITSVFFLYPFGFTRPLLKYLLQIRSLESMTGQTLSPAFFTIQAFRLIDRHSTKGPPKKHQRSESAQLSKQQTLSIRLPPWHHHSSGQTPTPVIKNWQKSQVWRFHGFAGPSLPPGLHSLPVTFPCSC